MTRYIDWADVAGRYPAEIAKMAGGSEELKNSYIVGAEDLVDGYAAALYATPFSSGSIPGLIKDCCIDAAYLKAVIRQDPKSTQALRDSLKERLEGIRDGEIKLTVNGTLVIQSGPTDAFGTHADFGSSFGVDEPEFWSVSSNWQQASEDARA